MTDVLAFASSIGYEKATDSPMTGDSPNRRGRIPAERRVTKHDGVQQVSTSLIHTAAIDPETIGKYRLVRLVGQGGNAQVYEALSPDGQAVAVKILSTGPDESPVTTRRFGREMAAYGQLSHPSLLGLLDSGWDPDRGRYLVTPYLEGDNLRSFGAQILPPEAALLLCGPLVEGLSVLHQSGFVHRDVKPENIMVTKGGGVVLIDFGLAVHEAASRLTAEGSVVGSVPYMSPEQIQGGSVTSASDVWSVGILTYELIAGKRPFQRSLQSEEVAAILNGVFAPLESADRRVSARLSQLISACLVMDPEARPCTHTLLAEVRSLLPWADIQTELKALVSNPAEYAAHNAERNSQQLRERALVAQKAQDSLLALKLLDQALAYTPNDPQLQQLVTEVAAGGRQNAGGRELPPKAVPSRFRPPAFIVASLTGALLIAAGWLAYWLWQPTGNLSHPRDRLSYTTHVSNPDAGFPTTPRVVPVPPSSASRTSARVRQGRVGARRRMPAPMKAAPRRQTPSKKPKVIWRVPARRSAGIPPNIKSAVIKNMGELDYCYKSAVKLRPGLGKVRIKALVTVNANGATKNVRLRTSTIPESLRHCVRMRIRGWRFPKFFIQYKYRFSVTMQPD